MQVQQDLTEVTGERDGLLVVCRALMEVITPEQFAVARRLAAARDVGLPEAGS